MPLPVFPTLPGLGFSFIKRQKFSTGRAVSASGRDVRVAYWSAPLHEWDLTYDFLRETPVVTVSELATLTTFVETQMGSFAPFTFTDPSNATDYTVHIKDDSVEYEQFLNRIWSVKKLTLEELRTS